MKKKPELDVDFIGGQDPLTAEEEKALTDFFRQRISSSRKTSTIKKQSGTANQIKLKA